MGWSISVRRHRKCLICPTNAENYILLDFSISLIDKTILRQEVLQTINGAKRSWMHDDITCTISDIHRCSIRDTYDYFSHPPIWAVGVLLSGSQEWGHFSTYHIFETFDPQNKLPSGTGERHSELFVLTLGRGPWKPWNQFSSPELCNYWGIHTKRRNPIVNRNAFKGQDFLKIT